MRSWAIGRLRQNQEVSPSVLLFRLCFTSGCCFFWVKLLSLKLIGRTITDLCLFRQTDMTLQYLLEERLEIKYILFQSRFKPTSFICEENPYSSCFRIFGQQGQRGRKESLFLLEYVPQMRNAGGREYLLCLSTEAVPLRVKCWRLGEPQPVLLCVKEKVLPYSTFSGCHFKENDSCASALGTPVLLCARHARCVPTENSPLGVSGV